MTLRWTCVAKFVHNVLVAVGIGPFGTAFKLAFVLALGGAVAIAPLVGCQSLGSSASDGDASSAISSGSSGSSGGSDAGGDAHRDPPIVVVPPGIVQVTTYAGSDQRGNGDGIGTAAQFDNPVGVSLDAKGNLFVTEYEGKRVRQIAPNGQTSTVYAPISDPFGIIAVGSILYVQTDRNANNEKTDTSGTIWTIANGNARVLVTGLGKPRGIVNLPDGKLALADQFRHTVSILDPGTAQVTLLAGAKNVTGLLDAFADSARFNSPYGCALLPDGSIVVADYGNNVIRRVTRAGDVTTFAGDGLPGMIDGSDKLKARFDGPQDVTSDALGNVLVSDANNFRIRRITAQGTVETIAGNGVQGFADGTGDQAEFYGQEQIEISPDGKTLFVSDGDRGGLTLPYNRIRKVVLP